MQLGRGDQHLFLGNILAEILLPGAAHGGDQLGVALGVAVMRVAGQRVGIGRVDDALVGGKIGIADAQINDVVIAAQRFRVERQAGRTVLETAGNVFTHDDSPHIGAPHESGA